MGNNCSHFQADLTLSFLECEYICKHDKQVIFAQRYIDDLITANFKTFMQIAFCIYPPELPLQCTNVAFDKVDFFGFG